MTSLAHQTLVEHQILEHVKDALRLTLEMKASSASLGRKLSSVRFMTQSFQRHLDRLLDLEEDGGYMDLVQQRRPQLFDEAIRLRSEHAEFRQLLNHILQGFEPGDHESGGSPPSQRAMAAGAMNVVDEARFHGVCYKLHDLLDRLGEHEAREIGLLEQVLIDKLPIEKLSTDDKVPIEKAD